MDNLCFSRSDGSVRDYISESKGIHANRHPIFFLNGGRTARLHPHRLVQGRWTIFVSPDRRGPCAITFPNQKEYTRTAIQSSSLMAEERRVYTHTGWCKVDGQSLFL